MRAPFARITKDLLPEWELSLAFVDAKTAKSLNKKLRGKTYVPNVLSYVVGKKSGEVIICKEVAREQAPDFGLSVAHFTLLLFIHALLHLAGGRHGATMEKRERMLLAIYAGSENALTSHGSSHRHRHRHRHLSSQGSRRRRAPR